MAAHLTRLERKDSLTVHFEVTDGPRLPERYNDLPARPGERPLHVTSGTAKYINGRLSQVRLSAELAPGRSRNVVTYTWVRGKGLTELIEHYPWVGEYLDELTQTVDDIQERAAAAEPGPQRRRLTR